MSLTTTPENTTSPLVLVVDDHPVNRKMMERQCTMLGLRVETTADGQEAFAKWRGGKFDLVITDCNMPVMDGYALAKAIRTAEINTGQHTPILGWTANVMSEVMSECQVAGMDDVLNKPADMMQMREKLSPFISLPESAAALKTAPIDLHELDKIAVNVAERGEILQDYLAQTHADLAELDTALQQQDWVEIKRVAHRIKGSSRMVGAQEMAVTCQNMEQANSDGAKTLRITLGEALNKIKKQTAELLAKGDAG